MLQAAGKACVGGTARSLADPNSKVLARKAVQCRLFRLMGLMFFKTTVTTTLEKSMKRGPQVSVAHLRRSAGTSNFWSWPLLVAMCRCQHHRRSMASRVRVVQKLGGYNKMVTLKGKGVRWCKQSWDFGVPYFETHVICRSTIGSVHFHCPKFCHLGRFSMIQSHGQSHLFSSAKDTKKCRLTTQDLQMQGEVKGL